MNQERKRWLGWLLAGALIVALIGGLAFYRPFQARKWDASPIEPAPPPAELDSLPGNRVTFLVMGVDNIGNEFGRSDSMVVVSYDPKEQRLAMLSIPRDTWTLIPGHGYDKINHAYAYGGHDLAVDTVERFLGIDINHWVTLSFDGFTKVVDAVGGVEVNNPRRLYYEDPFDERSGSGGLLIDIPAGVQTLDGETALKYARFRADAEGDLGRMRRQQEVITQVVKKAASPAIIGKLPQLIPATAKAVGTDLSVAEMLKLAAGGREAITKPLNSGAIHGEEMMLEGVFYFSYDLAATRAEAYQLLVGKAPDPDFVQRARQDNATYQSALADARARSDAAAEEAARAEEEAQAHDGDQATTGEGTKPGDSTKPEPQPGIPVTKTETITIALIDATGEDIAKDYVKALREAGFRIARVSKSNKILPSTLVIDHANQPQVKDRLTPLFPGLLYAAVPDPKAEQPVEVILGTDLLPAKNP